MERNDALRFPVFEDGKGIAVEGGDDALLVVDHGGVKHDLVNVFTKDVNALIVELFLVFFVLLGRRVGFWF